MHTTILTFPEKNNVCQVQGLCIWPFLDNLLNSGWDFIKKKTRGSCPPAVSIQKTVHSVSRDLFCKEPLYPIAIS